MRLRRWADHGFDDREVGPDHRECLDHAWRLRCVTSAFPGSYYCEVCTRCGALQIDGPRELTEFLDGLLDG